MKLVKTLLLAVTLTFSSVLMASTNPERPSTTESSKLTVKIERFLKNPSFDEDHEMTAKVTLTLNKNNELVVLSVESEDDNMESFIKSRLNYRKVSGSYETLNKKFVVPVKITTEE